MQLFIAGSCVSRDALALAGDPPDIVLCGYYARSSLAVLASGQMCLDAVAFRRVELRGYVPGKQALHLFVLVAVQRDDVRHQSSPHNQSASAPAVHAR